jgi:hypothetical protein
MSNSDRAPGGFRQSHVKEGVDRAQEGAGATTARLIEGFSRRGTETRKRE